MPHAIKGCPADFDATAGARWRLVKDDFGDDWSDVYASTLERYVRFLGLCDKFLEEIERRGGAAQLVTKGSQGQAVSHPLWNQLQQASQKAADAAEALCLTPRARKKATEAKAPLTGGPLEGRF